MLRRRRAIKRQKLKDARNQGDKKEENKQKSALRRYEYEMKKNIESLKYLIVMIKEKNFIQKENG